MGEMYWEERGDGGMTVYCKLINFKVFHIHSVLVSWSFFTNFFLRFLVHRKYA